MADDDSDGDDIPAIDCEAVCEFCGGSLEGGPFLALGVFAVVSEEGDGMFYQPDQDAADIHEWDELTLDRCLHITCVENYCAGVLADANVRRRQGEAE